MSAEDWVGLPASVIDRSAIDCHSKSACGLAGESSAGRVTPFGAIRPKNRRKTSRRLTSDPIRTSLGLLPSGPDPVGEWLVHRQSPAPYLGPKAPESKRGICRHARENEAPSKPGRPRQTGTLRNTGSSAFADEDALIRHCERCSFRHTGPKPSTKRWTHLEPL